MFFVLSVLVNGCVIKFTLVTNRNDWMHLLMSVKWCPVKEFIIRTPATGRFVRRAFWFYVLYARVNLISHMVWRIIDNGVSRWSETGFLFRRWSFRSHSIVMYDTRACVIYIALKSFDRDWNLYKDIAVCTTRNYCSKNVKYQPLFYDFSRECLYGLHLHNALKQS